MRVWSVVFALVLILTLLSLCILFLSSRFCFLQSSSSFFVLLLSSAFILHFLCSFLLQSSTFSLVLIPTSSTKLLSHRSHFLLLLLTSFHSSASSSAIFISSSRSDILPFLDRVSYLCLGDVVYTGSTRHMIDYFRSIGFPCPELENPLMYYREYLLACLSLSLSLLLSQNEEVLFCFYSVCLYMEITFIFMLLYPLVLSLPSHTSWFT